MGFTLNRSGSFVQGFDDEFVWGQAFKGLEASAVIVGVDEVCEVAFELLVAVVMVAFDGGFFDRPVHSLDLPVCPWMLDLGQAVRDPIFVAAHVKHVRHRGGCGAIRVARRKSKLDIE